MAWILTRKLHLPNGTTEDGYFKGNPFGFFAEVTRDPKEAKRYETKKAAMSDMARNGLDRRWEPVKYA